MPKPAKNPLMPQNKKAAYRRPPVYSRGGNAAYRKEKQVVLYYLNNIINHCTLRGLRESEFLQWVEDSSMALFGVKLEELWNGENPAARRNGECGGYMTPREIESMLEEIDLLLKAKSEPSGGGEGKTLPRSAKTVRALIARQNIADITADGFDRNIELILSAFRVAPEFRELLRYLIYCEMMPRMASLEHSVICLHGRRDCRGYADISGTPLLMVEKAFNLESELTKKGILIKDIHTEVRLSNKFRYIIHSKPLTEAQVKKMVFGKAAAAPLTRADFGYAAEDYGHIRALLGNALKKRARGVNILVYGEPGTGKTEFCKSVAKDIGAKLYMPVEGSVEGKDTDKDSRIAVLSAALTLLKGDNNALILFDEAEDIFTRNQFIKDQYSKIFFNRLLENNETPVIWISNDIRWMDSAYIRRFKYMFEAIKPDCAAKEGIWKKVCAKHRVRLSREKIAGYAEAYDIPPSYIDTAVEAAKLAESDTAIERTIAALQKATSGFAPAKKRADVVKFAPELLNTDMDLGGLADKLAKTGRSEFSLCLYGAPGTGKSAFARHLANMMGLKVVHKRASDLIDCYVGETEKNIARAFMEARDGKSMLIFDEADTFLRSRKEAVRGWEISQVNEMLTQMESHPYPFVCTTNLMDDMDEASLRRFMFKVKYGFLKPPQVELAFKRFFGVEPETPLLHLTRLTPGDFAVVKGKQAFLGVSDPTELVKMLESEQAVKGVKAAKMGFA